jgi:hypothetical protein
VDLPDRRRAQRLALKLREHLICPRHHKIKWSCGSLSISNSENISSAQGTTRSNGRAARSQTQRTSHLPTAPQGQVVVSPAKPSARQVLSFARSPNRERLVDSIMTCSMPLAPPSPRLTDPPAVGLLDDADDLGTRLGGNVILQRADDKTNKITKNLLSLRIYFSRPRPSAALSSRNLHGTEGPGPATVWSFAAMDPQRLYAAPSIWCAPLEAVDASDPQLSYAAPSIWCASLAAVDASNARHLYAAPSHWCAQSACLRCSTQSMGRMSSLELPNWQILT